MMKTGTEHPFRLLIVEDDPLDRQRISRILARSPLKDLQIEWKVSLEETLRRLDETRFAAIILDLSLSDAQGLDTLRAVCARAPEVPVVVVTGSEDETQSRNVLAAGAQDYLDKNNFRARDLERAIQYAIERKRVEVELREAKARLEKAVEQRTAELLRTTRMLARTRENLSKLIRHNVDGILVVDSLGIVRFANPAALTMFGRAPDSLIGEEFGFATIAGQKADIEIMHAGGAIVRAEMRIVSIVWEGESASLITVRDVTENRKTQEELERAIALKSEFVSMASHELRTPLTAINQSLWLVAGDSNGHLTTEQQEFLGLAKSNTDRLARLINDLLDFQKLDQKKMTMTMRPRNINQTVAEVCNTMRSVAAASDLTLKMCLDDSLPTIPFDGDRIVQVLTNLIHNAVKFTEEGSITIRTQADNEGVRICVCDTGPGIKPEDMPRLFQAFSQLQTGGERKTGGTGLGLAISREIIQAHRGRIWAETNGNHGTTFCFTLPFADRQKKGELRNAEENSCCR